VVLARFSRAVKTLAAGILLVAGVAYADEEPPPIATGAGGAVAGWSDVIIDNGLVMPPSDLGLYGIMGVARTTTEEPPVPPATMGIKNIDTAFDLTAGIGYGVNDQITVGGQYTFPVANGDGAFKNVGSLVGYGGYAALRDAKMALVVGADIQLDVLAQTTGILHAGVSFKYRLAPKVIFYSGNPLAPGPYGQQLVIGLNNSSAVALDVPVGFGFQGNPKLFLWAQTALAHIKIANTANMFFAADYLPLQVGALYRAAKDVDVGGFVDFPDLENISHFFAVGVTARYYKHAK